MVICDMIWYLTFTRAMESSVRANFFFFAWKATRPDARENCENTWIQSKEAHPSRREVRAQAEQTRRGRSPPLLQNQRCNFSLIPAGWASIGKFSYLLSQIERIMRRKVDGIPAVMAENKIHNFFSASTWIRSFVLMVMEVIRNDGEHDDRGAELKADFSGEGNKAHVKHCLQRCQPIQQESEHFALKMLELKRLPS